MPLSSSRAPCGTASDVGVVDENPRNLGPDVATAQQGHFQGSQFGHSDSHVAVEQILFGFPADNEPGMIHRAQRQRPAGPDSCSCLTGPSSRRRSRYSEQITGCHVLGQIYISNNYVAALAMFAHYAGQLRSRVGGP